MTRLSRKQPRISSWLGDRPGTCHSHFNLPPQGKENWPREIRARCEVAVVGAGLSGLTAAYHLRDRDVLVLDAGDTPGGVCQPGSYQGINYPAGSAYFYYPRDEAWKSWYRELGLPVDEALIREPISALFYGGRWYPDCFSERGLRSLPLPPAATDGLVRLAAELAAWEERWDPLGSDSLPYPELEGITLAHFLEQERGLPPQVTHLFDPYCRSCLGAGPEAISAWAGIFFLMSEFSRGAHAAAFPEGNARIAQALAQALPQPVRAGQVLVLLSPAAQGLHLYMWDSLSQTPYRLEAAATVLATGKFSARQVLPPESGWSPDDFKQFRYSSYLVAALCGSLSLVAPGYENWVVGEAALSDFLISPRKPQTGGARVMTVFAPQPYPGGREPLLRSQPREKGEELVRVLEGLFPGLAREVEEVRLYRFGHAQVVPYPGFLGLVKSIPQKQGRIILANSDLEGLPCIEAAIVQGQKAARLARATLERG